MIPRILLAACLASVVFPTCGGTSMRPASVSTATNDDATMTARVKTVLLNDEQVNATKIDVSTTAGIVSVSGTVKSQADAERAVELARQVTGVRDVKSTLTVSPTPQF